MLQALDTLLRPAPTPERQKAEALLATLSADDLLQGITDLRLSAQQRLLLAAVLGARELISREHLLILLGHLGLAEPSLLPKLAQIVAVHALQDEETYLALSPAILGMQDFSLAARVLKEVFLYRHRKLDRRFLKYLAALSADVISVLSGARAQAQGQGAQGAQGGAGAQGAPGPQGAPGAPPVAVGAPGAPAPLPVPDPAASGLYASRELAVPALDLAGEALDYVPVDLPALAGFWQPSLFFLLLDPATAPGYCGILVKLAQRQPPKVAQAGTLSVLEFINERIHAIVALNDYGHIQLLAGTFSTLCVLHQGFLRHLPNFLCRSLTMALMAFSSHPSHAVFDLVLPCLSALFNDLALRQVAAGSVTFRDSFPGAVQHYLRQCRFFVDKSEVRALTEASGEGDGVGGVGNAIGNGLGNASGSAAAPGNAPGSAAAPGAPPAPTPSALFLLQDGFHDPRYWREWFGGFKSRVLQLASKVAAAFPNLCLQVLLAFLDSAAELAASSQIPSVDCPEYMVLDSVFAVVEQCMAAVLRQARYESGFSVDGQALLEVVRRLTEFQSQSPAVLYRVVSSYLYLYKDAAASPGPHDYQEQLLVFVRQYLGVVFGRYLAGITFGGAPAPEGAAAPAAPGSGRTAFCTLSQDTLAFRRLCGMRLQRLTESAALLSLVFLEGGPTTEQVLGYLQSLCDADVVTEHERLLVNQAVVNILSFVGEEQSFTRHLSAVLNRCYSELRRVAQMQTLEDFLAEFHLSRLAAGDFWEAMRPSDPEVLLRRRAFLYALMESDLILPRVRQLFPSHESIGAIVPAVARGVELLLQAMQAPPGAAGVGGVAGVAGAAGTAGAPGVAGAQGAPGASAQPPLPAPQPSLRGNLLYAVSAEEVERCLGGRTRGVVAGPQKRTASGAVARVEMDGGAREAQVSTELEYVQTWLGHCACAGLRVLAPCPEQFYLLLSRLDVSRLPLHALKWVLREIRVGRGVPHSVEVLAGFARALGPSAPQLEFLYDGERGYAASRFGVPPASPYEQAAPLLFAGPQALQPEAQAIVMEGLYAACRRELCEKAVGADLLGVRGAGDAPAGPASAPGARAPPPGCAPPTAIPPPPYREAGEACALLDLMTRLGLLLLADSRGADRYCLYMADVATWLCRAYGPRLEPRAGGQALAGPGEELPPALPPLAAQVLGVCLLLALAHKGHENIVSVCAGTVGQLFALLSSWGQDGLAADTLMPFVSFEGEGMDVLAYLQSELQTAAQLAAQGQAQAQARAQALGEGAGAPGVLGAPGAPGAPAGGPPPFSPLASQRFQRRARGAVRDVLIYLGRLPAPAGAGRARNITLSFVAGKSTQEDSMDVNLGEYGMFDE